jgi:aspartyl protease family protein
MTASVRQTARWGALSIALVWMALAGLIYAGWSWHEGRQRASLQPYEGPRGELVLPRHADGHFYVQGEINRVPVTFLVDTGATAVSISDPVARQAQLPKGREVSIRTANGMTRGELIQGVPVRAGHLHANETTVVRGLGAAEPPFALLGQSFLKQFDIELREKDMVLRPRP